ncbi:MULTISPECIES: hypothetical protein [unclassified Streptomyces]|uniref:hypothetical protein n=1 Tax=unclassified Streptomyces TaxID=2593676 RepID=UPI0004C985A3|nr:MULTISPECIES: hypothetical protein [unclassified Streptomyces]KOV78383.1 hypothetical protein ADL02_24755 [Streptomyces sp. NRRL WC-3723]
MALLVAKDHTLALCVPTDRTRTAIHDGASLAGDLASAGNDAESGAEVGFRGGPVGTAVGGVVGGVSGGDHARLVAALFDGDWTTENTAPVVLA